MGFILYFYLFNLLFEYFGWWNIITNSIHLFFRVLGLGRFLIWMLKGGDLN